MWSDGRPRPSTLREEKKKKQPGNITTENSPQLTFSPFPMSNSPDASRELSRARLRITDQMVGRD